MMKLSKDSIQQFLEEAKQEPINFGWVAHATSVGDAAYKIAAAIQRHGAQEIDPEKARLLGYLHDVGKLGGKFDFLQHEIAGYRLLKKQGFPEEYCAVCLVHSFLSNDPFCNISLQVPDKSEPGDMDNAELEIVIEDEPERFLIHYVRHHQFSIYDNLISLCDALCCLKITTLEQRIVNVISRHGVCGSTQEYINKLIQLKSDFDEMAGGNIYELFPEIKENL